MFVFLDVALIFVYFFLGYFSFELVAQNNYLQIMSTIGADTPIVTPELVPLLTMDVWEHAYYLDHQNLRNKYEEAFVDFLIDWTRVEDRLQHALKA